ncbi:MULTISPECIES: hypothetical protein [unclassified Mesorhizobium]|uniref:hypothetical protein n=1 Tax=unclassified Mesorhizobium TaxID=325217 RepID=UPI0003CE0F20|nr:MULTISPECIES: hypothetical protein [unclassified Mesorhizobium]ESY48104.1 hypothetical protein X745_28735 [Mesorhizobium sp. LNJC374B00]ESY52253.1 hypothetical protein X744_29535 [Mesorhizobium sp. LNJC372A00]WJI81108.1 hypothetical protein NLY34_31270 [Mesorhizobium sp. C374B]WJI87649.1 hypothetical protein NLY42_02005 [Mesorhizobium sp. C372A]
MSIIAKIGFTAQKKAERHSGVRAGVPMDVATKLTGSTRPSPQARSELPEIAVETPFR